MFGPYAWSTIKDLIRMKATPKVCSQAVKSIGWLAREVPSLADFRLGELDGIDG